MPCQLPSPSKFCSILFCILHPSCEWNNWAWCLE
jgi:hypothetical protein